MNENKEYQTIQEIADEYGVTYTTIRRWTKDGLPFSVQKVVGRKPTMKIETADVEAYLKLRR